MSELTQRVLDVTAIIMFVAMTVVIVSLAVMCVYGIYRAIRYR